MLEVPYERNPNGDACALACATMVARYFFPQTNWDDIAKIVQWEPGYVVWTFKFMVWMMDKGIHITDWDLIDYKKWAEEGVEGLKASVPEKEFQFYLAESKDLGAYTDDIRRMLGHKNFTYHRQKPTFADLEVVFSEGALCEVTLNSGALNNSHSFSIHRVVVLDITDDHIIFHDPNEVPRPARSESREVFQRAWLEALDAPELCAYKRPRS